MTLGFKSRIILGVGLLVTLSLIVLGSLNAMSLRDNMVSALVEKNAKQSGPPCEPIRTTGSVPT